MKFLQNNSELWVLTGPVCCCVCESPSLRGGGGGVSAGGFQVFLCG